MSPFHKNLNRYVVDIALQKMLFELHFSINIKQIKYVRVCIKKT